jgi:hypothetical protein
MKHFDLLLHSGKTVFSLTDISLLFGTANSNAIKSFLQRAVKQRLLQPVAHGRYAFAKYDFWELASGLRQKSYISLESVLQKEGVIFQDYSHTVTLVSDNTLEKPVAGKNIRFSKIRDSILLNPLGLEYTGRYLVATKERAICDRTYLSGVQHFDNLSGVDMEKLAEIAEIYNKRTILGIHKIIKYATSR